MPELYTTSEVLRLIRDARNLPEKIQVKERAVLYALGCRLNPMKHKQYVCFPSLDQIAGDTSQSVRNAQRALKNLEAADLIVRQQRTNTSNWTWINVAKLLTFQPSGKSTEPEPPPSPIPVVTKDGTTVADQPPTQQPEPSPLSSVAVAITKLKFVGDKIHQKDADRVAVALLKTNSEEELLKVISGFDDEQLETVRREAKNYAGYLRRMIENAIANGTSADSEEEEEEEGPCSPAEILGGCFDDWIKETLEQARVERISIDMKDATDERNKSLIERIRQLGGNSFAVFVRRDGDGGVIEVASRDKDNATSVAAEPESDDEPMDEDVHDEDVPDPYDDVPDEDLRDPIVEQEKKLFDEAERQFKARLG